MKMENNKDINVDLSCVSKSPEKVDFSQLQQEKGTYRRTTKQRNSNRNIHKPPPLQSLLWMDENEVENMPGGLKPLERRLYLYHMLQLNTIGGSGLTMEDLASKYQDLYISSGLKPAKTDSIKRMIHRDLEILEEIGIAVGRPTAGTNYCLLSPVLPKISREHAALFYLTTFMYRGTLLDPATKCIKEQLEKVVKRSKVIDPVKFEKRLKVIGDQLISPEDFCGSLEVLITGIMQEKGVEFDYMKLDGATGTRQVDPLGLVWKRGVWYLVGKQPNSPYETIYRADQISNASLADTHFKYPKNFSLDGYFESSWGVYLNDKPQVIKVRFSSDVARRIETVSYHPSQKIDQQLDDGSIIVSYEISGWIEFRAWLLQWGTFAEVVEPEYYRENFICFLLEMSRMYKILFDL